MCQRERRRDFQSQVYYLQRRQLYPVGRYSRGVPKGKIVVKREKPIQELVKELLAAFPKMKDHKSLEYYMPADAKTDFPTEVDPRVDDGASPAAPGNVNVSYSTGKAVISFSASSSADVVGYRLYRSLNGGSFQKQSILMADENKVFTPGTPASANATFYVTAVDVAGNETASGSVAGGITPTPEATPTPDQQPGTEPPTEPETTPGDIIEDPGNILPLPTETPAGGGNSTGAVIIPQQVIMQGHVSPKINK